MKNLFVLSIIICATFLSQAQQLSREHFGVSLKMEKNDALSVLKNQGMYVSSSDPENLDSHSFKYKKSKGKKTKTIRFENFVWDDLTLEFYKDKVTEITFSKAYNTENQASNAFINIVESLSKKYPIKTIKEFDYTFAYTDGESILWITINTYWNNIMVSIGDAEDYFERHPNI